MLHRLKYVLCVMQEQNSTPHLIVEMLANNLLTFCQDHKIIVWKG